MPYFPYRVAGLEKLRPMPEVPLPPPPEPPEPAPPAPPVADPGAMVATAPAPPPPPEPAAPPPRTDISIPTSPAATGVAMGAAAGSSMSEATSTAAPPTAADRAAPASFSQPATGTSSGAAAAQPSPGDILGALPESVARSIYDQYKTEAEQGDPDQAYQHMAARAKDAEGNTTSAEGWHDPFSWASKTLDLPGAGVRAIPGESSVPGHGFLETAADFAPFAAAAPAGALKATALKLAGAAAGQYYGTKAGEALGVGDVPFIGNPVGLVGQAIGASTPGGISAALNFRKTITPGGIAHIVPEEAAPAGVGDQAREAAAKAAPGFTKAADNAGQSDLFGNVAAAPEGVQGALGAEAPVSHFPENGKPAEQTPATSAAASVARPAINGIARSDTTVKASQLEYRPDLFQARDADAGKPYGETRVKEIADNFDPALFEPSSVVPDPESPGKFIVFTGHHRSEAFFRANGPDAEMPVHVAQADIRDPAQLAKIRAEADASNFTMAPMNYREQVNVVQRATSSGETPERIASRLRMKASEVQGLQDAHLVGQGAIDRVVQEPALRGLLQEIGRGMRTYGVSAEDANGLFNRIASSADERPTAGALRQTIEKFGIALRNSAQRQQEGLGLQVDAGGGRGGLLELIDKNARLRTEISAQLAKVKRSIAGAGDLAKLGGPELEAARGQLQEAGNVETRRLQQALADNEQLLGQAVREAPAEAGAAAPPPPAGQADVNPQVNAPPVPPGVRVEPLGSILYRVEQGSMSEAKLREAMANRGFDVSGLTKDEIVSAIKEARAKGAPESPPAAATAAPAAAAEPVAAKPSMEDLGRALGATTVAEQEQVHRSGPKPDENATPEPVPANLDELKQTLRQRLGIESTAPTEPAAAAADSAKASQKARIIERQAAADPTPAHANEQAAAELVELDAAENAVKRMAPERFERPRLTQNPDGSVNRGAQGAMDVATHLPSAEQLAARQEPVFPVDVMEDVLKKNQDALSRHFDELEAAGGGAGQGAGDQPPVGPGGGSSLPPGDAFEHVRTARDFMELWLATSKDLTRNMHGTGALDRVLGAVSATLEGTVPDSFISEAAHRQLIAEQALSPVLGPREARVIAAAGVERLLADHYGADPKLIAEAKRQLALIDENNHSLHQAKQTIMANRVVETLNTANERVKNTMFALANVHVIGVHILNALSGGSVDIFAALVNRSLAALHFPGARDIWLDSSLDHRMIMQNDQVHLGIGPSGLKPGEGTILRYLGNLPGVAGKIGLGIDSPIARYAAASTRFQFETMLGSVRQMIYEGDLAIKDLVGQDVSLGSAARAHSGTFASNLTSSATTAVHAVRAEAERLAEVSPSMTRAQIGTVVQAAKLLLPSASLDERVSALTLILSKAAYTLVLGKLLNDVAGIGPYVTNPLAQGFGNITLPTTDSKGVHHVVPLFPQASFQKAIIGSINAANDIRKGHGPEGETLLRDTWLKYIDSRGSLWAKVGTGNAGIGYDENGQFHTGDLPSADRVHNSLPIPISAGPVISGRTDLVTQLLHGAGVAEHPEGTSATRERIAQAGYVTDPDSGDPIARPAGDKSPGVAYKDLLPSQQAEVNRNPDVTAGAHPSEMHVAGVATKADIDARLAKGEEAFLAGTAPKKLSDIYNDIQHERLGAKNEAIHAYADHLANIPSSHANDVIQGYYDIGSDNNYDYEQVRAARNNYLLGLSGRGEKGAPSDYAILADFIDMTEGKKTELQQQRDKYLAAKQTAGYFDPALKQLTPAEATAKIRTLDARNVDLDVQAWYFGGGTAAGATTNAAPGLNSLEAVDKALAMNLPNRPIKFADGVEKLGEDQETAVDSFPSLERPINQSAASIQAWNDSKELVDSYFRTALSNNADNMAKALTGKLYAQLPAKGTKSQASVKAKIDNGLRVKQPELDAWLAYWGHDHNLKTKAAAGLLKQIWAKYGDDPPTASFAPGGSSAYKLDKNAR